MSANKTGVKVRCKGSKSCEQDEEERLGQPDLSVLRKSINTSITSFLQARDVFDTGTDELRSLLALECDIVYECKVCRNLFRSLANFISHKRVYCRQKFNTSLHAHFINTKFLKDDMLTIIQNEQDYQDYLQNKDKSRPEPVQEGPELVKKCAAKDLTSIIEKLANKKAEDSDGSTITDSNGRCLKMQPILTNSSAVFQNLFHVNEPADAARKQSIEVVVPPPSPSENEAVLGPDGKLLNYTSSALNQFPIIQISDEDDDSKPRESPVCDICKMRFSTRKTLKFHTKHKHADNRLVYPCIDCSDTFSNPWSVYRHLDKVHRKSHAHIRKLRETIQNKAYRLQNSTLEANSKANTSTESLTEQQRMDQENQAWMENFEGDSELPRCGGCGRKFERRAALNSHSQTCQLRIAAHNKITNSQRRPLSKSRSTEHDKSPEPKLRRLDTCREEKKIEIKIRRDYIKGTAEPQTPEMSHSNSSDSLGEDGNIPASNTSFSFTDFQRNLCKNSNLLKTVKDFDDAYFIAINSEHKTFKVQEKMDVLESASGGEGLATITKVSQEASNVDDSELNLDDIERICHLSSDKPKGEEKPTIKVKDLSLMVQSKSQEEAIVLDDSPSVKPEQTVPNSKTARFTPSTMSRHQWKRFQCKVCQFRTYTKIQIINHIKTQHRGVGNKRLGSDGKPHAITTASPSTPAVVVELSDDEGDVKEEESQQKPGPEDMGKETSSSNKEEEASTPEDKATDKPTAKRGRPKGSFKVTKGSPSAPTQTNFQDKKTSPKDKSQTPEEKILTNSMIKKPSYKQQTSPDREQPSKEVPAASKPHNQQQRRLSQPAHSNAAGNNDARTMEIKITQNINSPQIASSKSGIDKRPVRNRVKLVNKDFEYDLSNILKTEAVAYKESHVLSVLPSQKQILKRKTLLQGEVSPGDTLTETGKQRRLSQTPPVSPRKPCRGALQSMSLEAARLRKAHVKEIQLPAKKEPLSFLRQPPCLLKPCVLPKPPSPPGDTTKTTAPTLTASMTAKTSSPCPTAWTTSDKSSSDKTALPAGPPPADLTPPRKLMTYQRRDFEGQANKTIRKHNFGDLASRKELRKSCDAKLQSEPAQEKIIRVEAEEDNEGQAAAATKIKQEVCASYDSLTNHETLDPGEFLTESTKESLRKINMEKISLLRSKSIVHLKAMKDKIVKLKVKFPVTAGFKVDQVNSTSRSEDSPVPQQDNHCKAGNPSS